VASDAPNSLSVGRPHERIVDDGRALKHGVLEKRSIVGHFVRDAVDDHRVIDRLVHRRSTKRDKFGRDVLVATFNFLDEAGGNDHSRPTISPIFCIQCSPKEKALSS
jgi:hypothetical protein